MNLTEASTELLTQEIERRGYSVKLGYSTYPHKMTFNDIIEKAREEGVKLSRTKLRSILKENPLDVVEQKGLANLYKGKQAKNLIKSLK